MSLALQRVLAGIDHLDGFAKTETGPLRGSWRGKTVPKELPKDSPQHDVDSIPHDPTPDSKEVKKQADLKKQAAAAAKKTDEPEDEPEGDEPEEPEDEPEKGSEDEPEDDEAEDEPEEDDEPEDDDEDDDEDDEDEPEPKKAKKEALESLRATYWGRLAEASGRFLVKFGSHRARDRAFQTIPKRRGLTSFHRETGKGVYEITPEEFKILKDSRIKGITKFKDGEDLRPTIDFG